MDSPSAEVIDEDLASDDYPKRLSQSFLVFPDCYFAYGNEEYSHVVAFADEDAVLFGSPEPNQRNELYVVASRKQKRFLCVLLVDEDGNVAPVEFDQDRVETLDIGGLGERWEGPTLNEEPFGWGKQYDEDGELKYEGFSIFGVYALYGTLYYSDIHNISYEGTWCDGCRSGRGRQFDRNGSLVYEGRWVNDAPAMDTLLTVPDSTDLLPLVSSLIVSLRIGEKCCCSNSSLVLHSFPQLRELVVGEESFGKESDEGMVFTCMCCPELVSISLGDGAMKFFSRLFVTSVHEMREVRRRQSEAAYSEHRNLLLCSAY